MRTRRAAAALLAFAVPLAAVVAPPASAQDAPKPAAPAEAPAAPPAADPPKGKEAKARRLLELLRFRETMFEQLDAGFTLQQEAGVIPKGFAKKFREVADFAALEAVFAEVWAGLLDEPTLDSVLEFLQTDAGKKYVEASLKTTKPLLEKIQPWAMENGFKTMQALMEGDPEEDAGEEAMGETGDANGEEDKSILGQLRAAKRSANETAAIATLRNLAACQAHIQCSGKIDCDRDGIGEYGTFLELTGSAGVRAGFEPLDRGTPFAGNGASDFSKQGTPVDPPIMSAALAGVDSRGVVAKSGYCFRLYLPDTSVPSGFLHETGPKEKAGLAGGTGKVCVDLAEVTWCAYAWPEKRGDSGNRAFFVNQAGDVLQSPNRSTKWGGKDNGPPPDAAFRGAGITSRVAVGTVGRDGEVWKVSN